jgi:putative ABC transport system permease protein
MRLLDLFVRGGRLMAQLAPEPLRSALDADGLATLRAVCLEVDRRRGAPGLVLAGLTELASIARAVIGSRLGWRTPVTAGPPPRRRSRGRGVFSPSRLASDVRLAARGLLKGRLPVAIAVGTLALGIGITSAVFSILDAVVLRPAPFAHADRLAEIWNLQTRSQVSHPGFGRTLLLDWRRQTDLFDRLEAFETTSLVHESSAGAEMLTGAIVTPGVLEMLGVAPIRGRAFAPGDGRAGADGTLVISERLWRGSMGRDPEVIGRSVVLTGRRYTIVGVMPAAFRFPNEANEFWLPYDLDSPPAAPGLPTRFVALARVRAGMPLDAAVAQVKTRGAALVLAAEGEPDRTAMVHWVGRAIDRKLRISLYVLAGSVAFLLLIVCANLASLSLSRALARTRDFAVRASLGASRADLVRESLVEHLLIGGVGALAGLGVAAATIELTLSLVPDGMRLASMNPIDLDTRALLFTAAVGLVTALLLGLPPAWLASRTAVVQLLNRDSRSSTGSPASRRLRGVLVVAEVMLAIVLLVGAALMARSFVKLQHVDRGFDTAGLVRLKFGLPTAGYADPYARDRFTQAMVERAARLPGVRAASSGGVPPDASMINFGQLERGDRPGELTDGLTVPGYTVWPNYFATVGIPLRDGRAFAAGEPLESVIVSESAARRFWPDGRAVGQRIRFDGGLWRTVVGVAGEVRQLGLDDSEGSFEFYYPLQRPAGLPPPAAPARGAIATYRTIVARTDTPDVTMAQLRRLVHDVDPRVVIWRADSIDRLFADAVARPRLVLLLMAVFAGLGLVLAAAGIYGVLSYAVVQRRREIGVRLALGAEPRAIGRLILGNGLRLTVVGLAAGIALTFGLMGVMRTLLYEVEPTDPLSVGAVAALLLAVACLASWHPSRRAMRLDPVALLRED